MDKLFILIGTIAIVAVLGGTLTWLMWDDVIPYFFPEFVKQGFLVKQPDWWKCVMFCWFIKFIFNFTITSESK